MSEEDERYRLEQRIDHATNESVGATRRIRAIAEETNQIGVDTLVTLNEQGEQLDNVERRLDEINVDLKQTDKNLSELEKCCGCCTCLCCAPKNIKGTKHYKKAYGKKAQYDEPVTNQPTSGGSSKQAQGPFIKRVTDDDREDEMEENLQAVSDVLGNLKGIATEMGGELDRQNKQLERVDRKADVNVVHLDQANRRIRNQL